MRQYRSIISRRRAIDNFVPTFGQQQQHYTVKMTRRGCSIQQRVAAIHNFVLSIGPQEQSNLHMARINWVPRCLLFLNASIAQSSSFMIPSFSNTRSFAVTMFTQRSRSGTPRRYTTTHNSYNNNKNTKQPKLEPPSVIFSNNHVLVVNKPPGWHSAPIDNNFSKKCILTHLKKDQLGGGSQKDFLNPLHRIDQPCTGVLMFAKNTKAAQRIQEPWKKGNIHKEYLCIVEHTPGMKLKLKVNNNNNSDGSKTWHEVNGMFHPKTTSAKTKQQQRSVRVSPIPPQSASSPSSSSSSSSTKSRICQLRYQILSSNIHISNPNKDLPTTTFSILRVVTSTGAKHQIRAMLSQLIGTPIAGDLRYGTKWTQALPDQSVALHARRVSLPTVKLGGMEFLKEKPFVAPIPLTWKRYFGLDEKLVCRLESKFEEKQ